MRTKPSFLFLFFLTLLFSVPLHAQQPSLPGSDDSLTDEMRILQSGQFRKLQALRLSDSIKRVELEQQFAYLRTTDEQKKGALLHELQMLKNADSLRIVRQKAEIDSLRGFMKGSVIAPFTKPLFYIYIRQGSLSPHERAAVITERIRKLSDDYFFHADSLRIVASDQLVDIIYGKMILIGISDNDALWMNTSKEKLAVSYKDIIAGAVTEYKHETNWKTLLYESGLALLVIVVVWTIIYLSNKILHWAKRRIIGQKDVRFKGIRIRNYQLLDAAHQIRVLVSIFRIARLLLNIFVIYLALLVIFRLFPWTRDFSDALLGYFLSPLKKIMISIWQYIPNLITIVVIVIVFRYVLKGLQFLKNEIQKGILHIPGFFPDWANPTYQIVRILILAFMMIVIFPYMPGSDSPVFRGVSVFIGVLFTFGSAGALGNVISGLVLTYMRAFKIGDQVKIGDVTGDIIEKSILVTRIRTIKNEIISIPNSTVMSSHTINFSSDAPEKGLVIHTTVTIGYEVPWRHVHETLVRAALATDLIAHDPVPFVMQTSLDDFYVSYQINAYTKEPNKQFDTYSLLHQHILDACNEAGIELMSPHYRGLRPANEDKMPPGYPPAHPPGGKQSNAGSQSATENQPDTE